jgi:exodeoxyribonuclease VII large subunit
MASDLPAQPVSVLVRRLRSLLEETFGVVWVEGECSNVKLHGASSHLYFTLKDAEAQIQCAWFAGRRRGVAALPQEGAQVRVLGLVTAYPRSSQYQLVVQRVEESGAGARRAALERLKAELRARGWFAEERKRPLPYLPAAIGVVTSPTGAAIQDILTVLRRRFPDRRVILAPARVQGEGAAEEIAAALDRLNAHGKAEVLIVGRGGGSQEDLWAFNEEAVAAAVHRSAIPVISAVGHETDFTLCDLVADLRAPTPSAAAELAVRPKADLAAAVDAASRRLGAALRARALALRNRLLRAEAAPTLRDPGRAVERRRSRVDGGVARLTARARSTLRTQRADLDRRTDRLRRRLEGALRDAQRRADELQARLLPALRAVQAERARQWQSAQEQLPRLLKEHLRAQRATLQREEARLLALSPLAVLGRGFSITLAPDGRALTDASDAPPGIELTTRLARGTLRSVVRAADSAPSGFPPPTRPV